MSIKSEVISSYTVKTGDSGIAASIPDTSEIEPYPLSLIFGGSDDGFAIDMSATQGLFVDSGASDPVKNTADLVGYVTDDLGNYNFTQGTASLKPDWTRGKGIKALNANDNMAATLGATLSDFTLITRITDVGNAGVQISLRVFLNGSNQMILEKTGTTVLGYSISGGSATSINIKTSYDSAGTVDTVVFRYNSTTGALMGQFNDEAQVTDTRTTGATFGTAMRLCGDGGVNVYTQPIKRMILIDRALSDDEVETAKTMVQNGWVE